MPRLPGQALRLGVDHDSLALVRTGAWFGKGHAVVAELRLDGAHDAHALAAGLRTLLGQAQVAGWPVRVVLADELARMWQVAPPPQAASPADLEAAAVMRYASLFGSPPAGWTIAADWHATQPFLAAALPAALLGTLAQCAREARCTLVEVVPQFVAALNGWRRLRRPGAWFGLVHGQVLSLAAYDGAQLAALRTAVVPPGGGRDWLVSHVAREALRLGTARPQQLQVCGSAPRSWASDGEGLELACSLLGDDAPAASSAVRLACTGSNA
jgi:hypothetical protein